MQWSVASQLDFDFLSDHAVGNRYGISDSDANAKVSRFRNFTRIVRHDDVKILQSISAAVEPIIERDAVNDFLRAQVDFPPGLHLAVRVSRAANVELAVDDAVNGLFGDRGERMIESGALSSLSKQGNVFVSCKKVNNRK